MYITIQVGFDVKDGCEFNGFNQGVIDSLGKLDAVARGDAKIDYFRSMTPKNRCHEDFGFQREVAKAAEEIAESEENELKFDDFPTENMNLLGSIEFRGQELIFVMDETLDKGTVKVLLPTDCEGTSVALVNKGNVDE